MLEREAQKLTGGAMNTFNRGDVVYIVKPGYLVEHEEGEPFRVVFDHEEHEHAYVKDSAGLTLEIPLGFLCKVPEGHVFPMDLGSTPDSNPCLACGREII